MRKNDMDNRMFAYWRSVLYSASSFACPNELSERCDDSDDCNESLKVEGAHEAERVNGHSTGEPLGGHM